MDKISATSLTGRLSKHTHVHADTQPKGEEEKNFERLSDPWELEQILLLFTQTSSSFYSPTKTTGYMFSPACLFHVLNIVFFFNWTFETFEPTVSLDAIVRSLSRAVITILHT